MLHNDIARGWNHQDEMTRTTFRRHVLATPFEGTMLAGAMMVTTIARKSLGATDLQIMLFTMIAPTCFLLSIYWAEVIRILRHWQRLFLLDGAVSFLPFLLIYFTGDLRILLAAMFFYELGNSLHIPLKNRVYQENYSQKERSNLYGSFSSLVKLVLLVVSLPLGRFLDAAPNNWRYIFIMVMIFGMIDRYLQFRVPRKSLSDDSPRVYLSSPDWMGVPLPRWRILTRPIIRMGSVLNRNRQFFRWEMQFMLYGLAFFLMFTLLPGFLVEGLELSYTWISLGQISLMQLAVALTLPAWGHLHDRLNPGTFASRVFLLLTLFPLMLTAAGLTSGVLMYFFFLLAFLVLGVAMSGVMMSWSLSSLVFAGQEDGAHYQSIHVTLTGVRGMIGPLIAWLVKSTLGWYPAFLIAFILLFLASRLMARQGVILGELEAS